MSRWVSFYSSANPQAEASKQGEEAKALATAKTQLEAQLKDAKVGYPRDFANPQAQAEKLAALEKSKAETEKAKTELEKTKAELEKQLKTATVSFLRAGVKLTTGRGW